MLIKKKYSKRKNYLVGRKSAQAVICDLHHKTKECNMKLYVLHYKNGKKKSKKQVQCIQLFNSFFTCWII